MLSWIESNSSFTFGGDELPTVISIAKKNLFESNELAIRGQRVQPRTNIVRFGDISHAIGFDQNRAQFIDDNGRSFDALFWL